MTKEPPHSKEIENCVLGTMLREKSYAMANYSNLTADLFYQNAAKIVLRHVLAEIIASGQPDCALIIDRLKRASEYSEGVSGYMIDLLETADSTDPGHLKRLIDYANRRKSLELAQRLIADSHNLDGNHKEAVEIAQKKMMEFESGADRRGLEHVSSIMSRLFENFENVSKGKIYGLETGFPDIDKKMGGFERGELIIVAGRPSMGKTAFAEIIAANVSRTESVAFFSQEMASTKLVMRALCRGTGISMASLQHQTMPKEQYPLLYTESSSIAERKLWIEDTSGVSIMDIISGINGIRSESPVLIVVDYLQLMKMTGKNRNREQEIAETSRALKILARNTNSVVIALAQLSRECERREDKRPMMSDLRESGAIEQDADKIIGIYRDEKYTHDSQYKGIAEIICLKNRNGETGTYFMGFDGPRMAFNNLTDDQRDTLKEILRNG